MAVAFIPQRIRQARHNAGMTQAELAARAGTRERNIVRWENGQHTPRLQHVSAIAAATGQDLAFFFAENRADEDDEEADRVGALMDALLNEVARRVHLKTAEPAASLAKATAGSNRKGA